MLRLLMIYTCISRTSSISSILSDKGQGHLRPSKLFSINCTAIQTEVLYNARLVQEADIK